jgi:hypothetical protein
VRTNKQLHDSIVNNGYFPLREDEDGFNAAIDSYYCSDACARVNKRLKKKFLFKTRDLEQELGIENADLSYEYSLKQGNPICIHDIYGDPVDHYRLDGTKVFSLKNWFIRLYRTIKGLFINE